MQGLPQKVKRIKKIKKLDNFRGFESLDNPIDTDRDIVLITGSNGSGKSSILYAIHCIINGFYNGTILGKDIVGEMVRSGLPKAACEIEYYDDDLGQTSSKPYSCEIPEKPMELNVLSEKERQFIVLQGRATAVYQDLITDPRINEFVLNLLGDLQSELQIEKKLRTVASSIEQEIRNKYLRYENRNLEESRMSLINKFTTIINRIKSYNLQAPKSINSVDFPGSANWRETYEALRDFAQRIEYELDIKDNETLAQSPQNILVRIENAFKILIEQHEKEQSKNTKINNKKHFEEFLEKSVSDSRILKTIADVKTLKDIQPNTILFLISNDERDAIEKLFEECQQRIKSIQSEFSKYRQLQDVVFSEEKDSYSFDSIMRSIQNYNNLCAKMKEYGYPLPERISKWLETQKEICEVMEQEYLTWRRELDKKVAEIEDELYRFQQLSRNLDESLNLNSELLKYYSRDFILNEFNKETYWTYGMFVNQILNKTKKDDDASKARKSVNILADYNEMINILDEWVNLEKEISSAENAMMDTRLNAAAEKAKKVLNAINKMAGSKYKLDISQYYIRFKDNELKKFNKTLNEMLRQFHFPHEFLPVNIERKGKSKTYTFLTGGKGNPEVDFSSLSTGQKAIVYFCWTIALNYSLKNKTHNIMLFDDITTSLDMSQLLSVAKLLRQMSYSDSHDKRQVFISCHHEDFSNRLLDYLIPPPGKTLKVIRLIDLRDGKPVMEQYSVEADREFDKKKKDFLNIIKRAKEE